MNAINNIHNLILKKIESGAIRQKPKWHFVLMTLGIVFGVIALFLVLLYLVSFVALFLREHLLFEALSFGPRTVFEIVYTLPFLLIILVTTVFLILHVLVRHFAFAYMKPVAATLGLGLLFTLFLFALVLIADKESKIARFGQTQRFPGIEAMHMQLKKRAPPLVLAGTLLEVEGNVYKLTLTNGDEVTLMISDRTRKDRPVYEVGDPLVFFLQKQESGLFVIAIRLYDENQETAPHIGYPREVMKP